MKDPQLLVYGSLLNKAEERTDTRGKSYTVAHIECETHNSSMRMFVISHVERVSLTLQSFELGDVIALSGSLSVRRDDDGNTSVGIIARRVLSALPMTRE